MTAYIISLFTISKSIVEINKRLDTMATREEQQTLVEHAINNVLFVSQ